jgi:hypothetical protein
MSQRFRKFALRFETEEEGNRFLGIVRKLTVS